ncbi:heterokaryon incompatibility protein-domain-containing protein [Cercophora scortea]|uniref:Heterokaryon incompatibility protein-domain-containing protein n=1 Tax=Cercophora scortea TaxID=314031 RepID=A0AAE0IN43_9PEZI|nr:heterokaryon incompatibility protein-domain-containing protein [Cercophora scortea]
MRMQMRMAGPSPSPSRRTFYRYEPLPSPDAIRLLELHVPPVRPNDTDTLADHQDENEIHCSLKSFRPSEAPAYRALSYTWGHPLPSFSRPAPARGSQLGFRQGALDSNSSVPPRAGLGVLDGGVQGTAGHDDSSPDAESQQLHNRADARRFPIYCDGRTMLVTANLHDALHMLKGTMMAAHHHNTDPAAAPTKHLWIDAVCVNQDDVEERNAQVARMAQTFLSAESVEVWLGAEDQFTADAIAVIEAIASIPESLWNTISYTDFFDSSSTTPAASWHAKAGLAGPIPHASWLALIAFINRPWFRRAWVVQELTLARTAALVCGAHRVAWDKLDRTLSFVRSRRWYHHLSTDKMRHLPEIQAASLDDRFGDGGSFLASGTSFSMGAIYLSRTRRRFNASTEQRRRTGTSLEDLLQMHRETLATDPRDKVYAFLGLADRNTFTSQPTATTTAEAPTIKPDYSLPVHQVYTSVTTSLMLSQGDLRLLSHVQDASLTKIPDLPSWVPDYSVVLDPYPLLFRGKCNWSAAGHQTWTPPTAEVAAQMMERDGLLPVTGYMIDTITHAAAMPDEVADSPAYWAGIVDTAAGLADYYPFRSTVTPNNPARQAPPQSRIEALWRTLVANSYARTHPAPTTCGTLFIDYVLNMQARQALSGTPTSASDFLPHHQHHRHQTDSLVPAWHRLLDAEPEGSPYGRALYRARIACVVERMFQGTYEPIELAQLQHELDVASGRMRRVFRTEGGYLGTGPRSLKAGDEVWVLAGANVPMVLRRPAQGTTTERRRRLVGEAYVHGFMHSKRRGGDASVSWVDVVLE